MIGLTRKCLYLAFGVSCGIKVHAANGQEAPPSERNLGHRVEDDTNAWLATLEHIADEYRQYQLQSFGSSSLFASPQSKEQLEAMEHVLNVMQSDETSTDTKRNALTQLARRYFYGRNDTHGLEPSSSHKINGTLSLQLYAQAAMMGDPEAQFHVGVAYSYGYWGYPRDEAKALLYYYFAALGENSGALMALGHKHAFGLGVQKSCATAVRYYEMAADQAISLRESRDITQPRMYDIGHRRIKRAAEVQHKKAVPTDDAMVDYFHYAAEKGDPDAALNTAYLYYYGIRAVSQDTEKAALYFEKAYKLGAEGASYHMGHIHVHGIGVPQNIDLGLKYLNEAVQNEKHASAQNELGTLYLEGKYVKQDSSEALKLFRSAAKHGNMESIYNIAILNLNDRLITSTTLVKDEIISKARDPKFDTAFGYLQVAAQQGHTLSKHKIGLMNLHGIGTKRSCTKAMKSFKDVSERGDWDRIMWQAHRDFKNQEYEASFMKYAVMAEQGYEVAQHNAAYLLDYGYLSPYASSEMGWHWINGIFYDSTKASYAESAVRLYKLAALQDNIDANLKIGDYYYYGKGGLPLNYDKAGAHYRLASKQANAQATYNLGYMYEHGIGVDQDFHLAKRYYDRAKEFHQDARVPINLAQYKLQLHHFWRAVLRKWRSLFNPHVQSTEAPDAEVVNLHFQDGSWQESIKLAIWTCLEKLNVFSISQDEVMIGALTVALGVILYIRQDRQNRLYN